MTPVRLHPAAIGAEKDRVVAQLFLPGEEASPTHSRAAQVVERVMTLTPQTAERISVDLVTRFGTRHADVVALFLSHADVVGARLMHPLELTVAQRTVLGATFTSEFAVEGAALCNPSAFAHPDQTGLPAGALRVAMAVRSIGEGHISSIGFAEAVIGPGRTWTFAPRARPLARATVGERDWSRDHFLAAVEAEGSIDELTYALLNDLPERFTATQMDAAIDRLPEVLSSRPAGRRHLEGLRELARSTYRATFAPDTVLSQRVLLPVAAEENHGMEDARFVRHVALDGEVDFRATYTAYDGRDIAPRLITTNDLQDFAIHRLTGDAARNKGMALFPRPVGGRYLALTRTGGEDISLATSLDGVIWAPAGVVHEPTEPWEVVQTGNCGSPIETPRGWLVLLHGVGAMRTYSLGALLLDLDDPTIVLGRTTVPILEPTEDRRDGYVPNVVYSCGAIVHDDELWIPIGIGDARIGVCSIGVEELLDEMTP